MFKCTHQSCGYFLRLGLPTFQVRNFGHCSTFSSFLPSIPFPLSSLFLLTSSPPVKQPEVSFPSDVQAKHAIFCDILSPGNVSCDNYGRFVLIRMVLVHCVKITCAHVVPVLVELNIRKNTLKFPKSGQFLQSMLQQ